MINRNNGNVSKVQSVFRKEQIKDGVIGSIIEISIIKMKVGILERCFEEISKVQCGFIWKIFF